MAAGGTPDQRSPRTDELRAGLVLAGGAQRHYPRDRGDAGSPAPETLKLRVRLPRGQRVEAVTVNGAPLVLPEGETLGETLDLSGLTGRLEVIVHCAAAARPRRWE